MLRHSRSAKLDDQGVVSKLLDKSQSSKLEHQGQGERLPGYAHCTDDTEQHMSHLVTLKLVLCGVFSDLRPRSRVHATVEHVTNWRTRRLSLSISGHRPNQS